MEAHIGDRNNLLYSDEISWLSLFSNDGKYERMGAIMNS